MSDLTPESLAELRRLLDEHGSVLGYQPITDSWFALARRSIGTLPALLDAAAERDALAAKVAAVRGLTEDWRAAGFADTYGFSFDLFRALDATRPTPNPYRTEETDHA